jgi:hypothetical protein
MLLSVVVGVGDSIDAPHWWGWEMSKATSEGMLLESILHQCDEWLMRAERLHGQSRAIRLACAQDVLRLLAGHYDARRGLIGVSGVSRESTEIAFRLELANQLIDKSS